MGKDFKDIDLGQPTKAAEPAVDFAVEEDVDIEAIAGAEELASWGLHLRDDDEEVVIPQEKLEALLKKYPMRSPSGLEYGRKPQTKEQWDEWHREAIYEYENGLYCSAEDFFKGLKEDYPWLFK